LHTLPLCDATAIPHRVFATRDSCRNSGGLRPSFQKDCFDAPVEYPGELHRTHSG
jgi:hypothetical protein